MLPLKSIAILIIAGLLATACANRNARDSTLRQQIVGTWSQSASAKITFLSDGSFNSDVKRPESSARTDGTWQVDRGSLVVSINHVHESYKPGMTKVYSVSGALNPTFHKILAVDGTRLTIVSGDPQMDVKTNSWERQR